VPIVKPLPTKMVTPISFNCQEDTPMLDDKWETFRDSLVELISDDRVLEIKTYEFNDERQEQEGDLAIARGTNVRQLFTELPENKVRFNTGVFEDDCIKKRMYELVDLRALRNSTKVKETADGALIYFPSNSTEKIADPDIEAYLDDVAQRVIQSKERVRLTGHTDASGDAANNLKLGQARADNIRDYLMSKGVASIQILASSKGEADPIASNDTAEGREKNRRTELNIIK
jgi:outer membrane protein OmpA-like peptidoglycan-associated protein